MPHVFCTRCRRLMPDIIQLKKKYTQHLVKYEHLYEILLIVHARTTLKTFPFLNLIINYIMAIQKFGEI